MSGVRWLVIALRAGCNVGHRWSLRVQLKAVPSQPHRWPSGSTNVFDPTSARLHRQRERTNAFGWHKPRTVYLSKGSAPSNETAADG